jgi:uncharacterized protein YrzB (UPF0473 family)
MTNEADAYEEQEGVITLEGEDGNSYTCQIIRVIELDGKEYALLLNLNDEQADGGEESEEGSLVIMGLTQKDEQAIFNTIESEEEFNKVVAYVQELAREEEAELEAEESPN